MARLIRVPQDSWTVMLLSVGNGFTLPTSPVLFITGASRGIGAATALRFAQGGWRVFITARSVTHGQQLSHQLRHPDGHLLIGSLKETADGIRAVGGEVDFHEMDLLDQASIDRVVNAVMNRFGSVDLLINNAVYQDREMNSRLLDLDEQMLTRTLQANVTAPFQLTRRLLPIMIKQGSGQIINVCSGAGMTDPPAPADEGGWGFAYGASKAALIRLAGCINVELGGQGIRAYSVNPGVVATEALTATLGSHTDLLSRYGALSPQAIASAIFQMVTDPQIESHVRGLAVIQLPQLIRDFGISPDPSHEPV
jgi:NAD(P)-dependent dehydrogenase (short-subunit alcohol dehydrogenase family)